MLIYSVWELSSLYQGLMLHRVRIFTFTTSRGHCLEQMVTYGMLILWQRNFALCIGKKGIGTQGLKLEIAVMGKTRVVNDRGAEREEGEMMKDVSSTTCAYFCHY